MDVFGEGLAPVSASQRLFFAKHGHLFSHVEWLSCALGLGPLVSWESCHCRRKWCLGTLVGLEEQEVSRSTSLQTWLAHALAHIVVARLSLKL